MKLFKCTRCGQLLYFENSSCERCGDPLGFDSDALNLFPLELQEDNSYKIYNRHNSGNYVYCVNATYGVCNWLVSANNPGGFCRACELNHMIPNLSKAEYIQRWQVLENAKHRLVYSLLRMKLPLVSKAKNTKGLYFDFLADENRDTTSRILTGHNEGLITINIAEADDIEREMARRAMDEVYRTVLGHFRHEIGHYYWDQLIPASIHLNEFRKLFGDERADYAEALKRHYREGSPKQWDQEYISAYATTHPWEDWAETWAHYLHIMDTLETAYAFGLTVKPAIADSWTGLHADISTDPYDLPELESIINLWLPLTFTMNSLNRSMGLRDPYPFLIRPRIMEKMKFIHDICYESRRTTLIESFEVERIS
jgi:hypothetical protein